MSEIQMQQTTDGDPKTGLPKELMTLAALTPVLADPESPMFAKPGSSIPDTPEHFTFPDCEVPVLSLPEIPGTDILDPLDFISPLSESPAPPSTKEVIANDERPTRFRLTHFCPECLAGFTNKGKLAEHMISVHNIDRPVKCDSCDASFRSPLNFARHKRIHETDKHFSCDLCSYSSSQKSNLTLHRRRHTKNYAYQCELCGCGFMQRTKYVEHQQRHEGQGYECKICKNVFNYRRNLVAHVKGCHPETLGSYQGKLLRCEFCHRDFTNEISRKRHQRQMHASLLEPKKKCLCDICGMQLSSPTALRIHIRGHSGEKVAKCDDCGKAFTKWTNLKIHQRVHTGEKPYVCTQCGKGFTQKTTLVYHTRVHTGERPYSCDVCGKGFVSNSLLRKHANTHEKAIEKQKQVVA